MKTVHAAVIPAPHQPVEVRELRTPELAPDSALLRVRYSEVCGTDVHLQNGELQGTPYPLIPGHACVGVLEEIRGKITGVNGEPLSEGQMVTFLDVHSTCGECWYCLVAKASTRCPHRKIYGITYGLQDGCAGGWCEVVYLRPGTRMLPIENNVAKRFMAGGCALPRAVHAIERARIALGDIVLVLGTGPVGLSAIAFARASGASRVLAIGSPAQRLIAASKMGAQGVKNLSETDQFQREEWVRRETDGRGADVVIEATGCSEAVGQAMRYARDAGRIVIVGQYADASESSYNAESDLNRKHLDIRGSWGCDFSHLHRGLQYLKTGALADRWDAMEMQRYPLGSAQDALDAVAAGKVVKALIEPGAPSHPRPRSVGANGQVGSYVRSAAAGAATA
jgi:threonine dehydrogenase-like Zn-dependent dehydrogenase